MTAEEIKNYVMNTPGNTNPAVLMSMLSQLGGSVIPTEITDLTNVIWNPLGTTLSTSNFVFSSEDYDPDTQRYRHSFDVSYYPIANYDNDIIEDTECQCSKLIFVSALEDQYVQIIESELDYDAPGGSHYTDDVGDHYFYNALDNEHVYSVFNGGGYIQEAFKFTGGTDAANPQLIAWLKANGTFTRF